MRKAKVLDRRVFREGQVIFREGEQSWAAFLVESGSVDIIKQAEGTVPRLLATIGAGDLFGEMGLIDGSPRSATARAAEMPVVQVINEREFHRLLTTAEPGLVALLKVLLRRLRATNQALVEERGDEVMPSEAVPCPATIPGPGTMPGHGVRSAPLVSHSVSALRPV
jgi:CRP-like cAMP-binding protein